MEEVNYKKDAMAKINEIVGWINDKEKKERETYNSLMESYEEMIKERDDKSNS